MMAQKKTAGTLLSGLHVLVILSALVLVTVLVTCLIGHSKMGARLWSDRRGGNRSSNPSSPRHTHHTSLTPANFTHSVRCLTVKSLVFVQEDITDLSEM
ncbi:uncharacterized protein LOC143020876 isoform X3 [Oratosquilla oratoria]|uniref:uncharacterized protein LOC143020876 isoform X3 n=1 Tax=Oratosquilla oratoria TaxID=337810 RepID=UPI003F76D448